MDPLDITAPLDVPQEYREFFIENLTRATQGTGRLMLFAGDQKAEHMNDDFYGATISKEDNDPEHMFAIASKARIGAFATQLELIAKYGADYRDIPYVIKLNAKTNLVHTNQKDPVSKAWVSMQDVMDFRKSSGLHILGIGYTVYVGSEFEQAMLQEASQFVIDAHKHGLFAILWMYPRGKAVIDEKDPHIIAGAAGLAATLGADFVKVNPPKKEGMSAPEALKEAVVAAGRTRLICAGGASEEVEIFLKTLYDQIHIAGTFGNATGRNIHQRPLDEAIRFANAIAAITYDNKTVAEAMAMYDGKF